MMQASEAAGLNAMAQALVASGHLTQEAAGQMLASEYAAGGYAAAPGASAAVARNGANNGAHSGAHNGAHFDAHAAASSQPTHAGAFTAGAPAFPAGSAAMPALNPAAAASPAGAAFLAHDPAPHAQAGLPQAGLSADAAPASGATPQQEDVPDAALDPTLAELQALPIDPLFAPPQTPDGYALELDPRVKMDPQDISAVRAWFHTMRLPQSIAQSLYSETERMHRAGPPSASEIDRLTAHTRATLARAWGERTDAMLSGARRLVDTAARAHPGLKAALARGPGSNPVIVRQLAEHAQRLYGGAAGHGAAPNATAHKGD
jgi:hypothetical protein